MVMLHHVGSDGTVQVRGTCGTVRLCGEGWYRCQLLVCTVRIVIDRERFDTIPPHVTS